MSVCIRGRENESQKRMEKNKKKMEIESDKGWLIVRKENEESKKE